MDKPKNRNTITIKINGKDSPFQENKIENPVEKPQDKKKKDKNQSKALEHVELESAAARELIDDSEQFEWILPEKNKITEIEEYKKETYNQKKKAKSNKLTKSSKGFNTKKPSINLNMTMILAIFFAVLLGTFFGLMLLRIVPANTSIKEENPPIVEEENKPSAPEDKSNMEWTNTSLSLSVVQEGVYTTQEAAEQSKEKIKDSGAAAEIFSMNEKFAIFVGLAENIETAKLIGSKTSSTETYSKDFSISEKKVTNLNAEEKKLLDLSIPLFKTLLAGGTNAFTSNQFSSEIREQLKNQAQTFSKIDKGKLKNKEIIQIHSQLEAAVTQFKLYEKEPKSSTLNLYQQHLLTFLASYQKL